MKISDESRYYIGISGCLIAFSASTANGIYPLSFFFGASSLFLLWKLLDHCYVQQLQQQQQNTQLVQAPPSSTQERTQGPQPTHTFRFMHNAPLSGDSLQPVAPNAPRRHSTPAPNAPRRHSTPAPNLPHKKP